MEENKQKTNTEEAVDEKASKTDKGDGNSQSKNEKIFEKDTTENKYEENVKKSADEQSAEVSENENEDADTKAADGEDKGELGLEREGLSDEEYIARLEEKLGQCIADSVMCRNMTQRLQADFDNYRKRNASAGEDMKQLGISLVIEKLLGVLDNCDLARKYLKDEASLTGFNMMETQIINALSSFGLEEVKADGQDFDAKFMNAVERVKAEGKEGKVIEVLAKGYTLNGRLLRPASVMVGSNKE